MHTVNLNTHIIFSDVLCQASNHDCIVRGFIFVIIPICISWGIPTHPGYFTVTSNNKCYVYKAHCALCNVLSLLVNNLKVILLELFSWFIIYLRTHKTCTSNATVTVPKHDRISNAALQMLIIQQMFVSTEELVMIMQF